MGRLAAISRLLEELGKPNPEDADAFHRIITSAFELSVIDEIDVAHKFGMSRPSINRWRNGRTVPHPAMRAQVYGWLTERLGVA